MNNIVKLNISFQVRCNIMELKREKHNAVNQISIANRVIKNIQKLKRGNLK